MPPEDEWEEPDPDSLMRSERKHEWISEPRYKRMFDDIEHARQETNTRVGERASTHSLCGARPSHKQTRRAGATQVKAQIQRHRARAP